MKIISDSKFHRIKSDEIWHFYAGSHAELYTIDEKGDFDIKILGAGDNAGFQHIVPKLSWQAARTTGDYSLLGCTVSPGFEFEDFEMAQKIELLNKFPKHKKIIEKLS